MNWQGAKCRGMPQSLFFAEDGLGTDVYREAKIACAWCPITQKCLEYALRNHIDHGLWGGKTPRQRRQLARAQARERRSRAAQ